MAQHRRRLILAIVATDRTFALCEMRGRLVWAGKCLHCNSQLLVSEAGELLGKATVEHILPRHHGGDDSLENLGLACARCNGLKGSRHDRKPLNDPKLAAMIERLQSRRQKRWRDPPEDAPA